MADRQNVIDSLEHCTNTIYLERCEHCAYSNYTFPDCELKLTLDALELLKEQEAVKPGTENDGTPGDFACWWYVCGNCGRDIDPGDNYCRHCGRAVKWND